MLSEGLDSELLDYVAEKHRQLGSVPFGYSPDILLSASADRDQKL